MRILFIVIAAAGLAACSDQKSEGADTDARVADGRTIAEEQCSRCHAVGATGESRNPKAPVFRTILSRYAEDALVNDLAEGIRIGHPDMPEITLRPEGVDALVVYLRSVQEKPGG
jgi:cytochrome c